MRNKKHRKFWVKCPKRRVDDTEPADIPDIQEDRGIPSEMRAAIRHAAKEE